jgi:voltage-dependent anion channel protein 2
VPDDSGGRQKVSLTGSRAGITVNGTFNTASLLDAKVELTDILADGVKADIQQLWNPAKDGSAIQKLTLAFKNPNIHSRAFINHAPSSGNIDAVVDATFGHEGFLVGGEAGYDVQKAAITKYSFALGYQAPTYSANLTATQSLNVIAFNLYQKVNSATEVGVKTGYDVQAAKASGLEAAAKYKLDPLSFAKAKLNDRGILALAYSTKLNTAVTAGLGLSLDTTKMNEAGHKIGANFVFEG